MLVVEVLRMKVRRISVGFCCGKTHMSSTLSVEYTYIYRPVFQDMSVFSVVLYKTRHILFKTLICLLLVYIPLSLRTYHTIHNESDGERSGKHFYFFYSNLELH